MKLGAIIIVGKKDEWSAAAAAPQLAAANSQTLFLEPLASIEVCGRTVLDRLIGRFLDAGVETLAVLIEPESAYRMPKLRYVSPKVTVRVVNDIIPALDHALYQFSQNGVEHSFISSVDAYTETDLLDFFYFHKEARRPVTRAFDRDGLLDLWVIDCARSFLPHSTAADLERAMRDASLSGSAYFIKEYVLRLVHARDLRQLAFDTLHRRCERGPAGEEIRPGVWLDTGADLHRHARIVAPAYIGKNSKILEDVLVTRGSTVEENCVVDCGTVIENSTILAGTNVGIWLDVCHALVKENRILSLERDVMVEISDTALLRSNFTQRESIFRFRSHNKNSATEFIGQPLTPDAWQFGANLIPE